MNAAVLAMLVGIELARQGPAWMRVRTQKTADGYSFVSLGLLNATTIGWAIIGVGSGSWSAVVALAVWQVLFGATCWECLKVGSREDRRRFALSLGGGVAVMVGVALAGWVSGTLLGTVGVCLAGMTVTYSVPALMEGLRAPSTAGLSAVALAVSTVEAGIYLSAGAGLGGASPAGTFVLGYALYGAISFACTAPRLVRVLARRYRGADQLVSAT